MSLDRFYASARHNAAFLIPHSALRIPPFLLLRAHYEEITAAVSDQLAPGAP